MTYTLPLLFCLLIASCKEKIEISTSQLYIEGGIKDELFIRKVSNSNPKHFPQFPEYKEVIQLQFHDNSALDKSCEETINLYSKNDNYYWIVHLNSDNNKHDTLPIAFTPMHWYVINNFTIDNQQHIYSFFVNKKGEIRQKMLNKVVPSPI